MTFNRKQLFSFFVLLISFCAVASYFLVPEPYTPGCDACNSAAIDRAGYRALGRLKPRQNYTFVFSDNMTASFYFSTPLSSFAFQQKGSATKCAYSCHQENNEGASKNDV